MRRRQEFELAVREGKRAGGRLLTVHLLAGDGGSARDNEVTSPRIGFVVTRAVGGAVVRNRVRRRLRDLARMRAGWLPAGSLLVIRANPRAADVRQRDLAADSIWYSAGCFGGRLGRDIGHDRATRQGRATSHGRGGPTGGVVGGVAADAANPALPAVDRPDVRAAVQVRALVQRLCSGGAPALRRPAWLVARGPANRPVPSLPPGRLRSGARSERGRRSARELRCRRKRKGARRALPRLGEPQPVGAA